MWTAIRDCGKQLTIHSKVREKIDDQFRLYNIIEVEFDQYKLQVLSPDNVPAENEEAFVLSCDQMIQYQFEVDETHAH